MKKVNKQAIVEAAKELARIAFLGALSAVLAWATTKVAGLDPSSVYAVVGTIVLRTVDRFVHESSSKFKGVSPV